MTTKTIVITGSTTGIGFACASYLITQNYRVIITGKNPKNVNTALELLNHKAVGYVSDTSNLSDITTLVMSIKDSFGTIDGIFINAGIFKAASFETTTEELFDQTMNINFKGAFFTLQQFIPILNNPSSIVLNTSIAVFKAFADTSAYSASKAALESIAKVLNIELASKGIRINIVSPGVTKTPIQKKSGMSDEAIDTLLNHFSETSPLKRIVEPLDIAPIVEFLLSNKSIPLRNEKIVVDGGTTL